MSKIKETNIREMEFTVGRNQLGKLKIIEHDTYDSINFKLKVIAEEEGVKIIDFDKKQLENLKDMKELVDKFFDSSIGFLENRFEETRKK